MMSCRSQLQSTIHAFKLFGLRVKRIRISAKSTSMLAYELATIETTPTPTNNLKPFTESYVGIRQAMIGGYFYYEGIKVVQNEESETE